MCGISGIFNYRTGAPVDLALMRAMNDMLVHRGPDDDGYYASGAVALAQRRLSIIDVEGGHQPLSNEDDSIWITYNGEIYNFQPLMKELAGAGHRFKTRTDTEVVVHAWEQWGAAALPRLNGMFGFALWDARNQQLILARDPYGVKPLYLWENRDGLCFASELKAFLPHPEFRAEVDEDALDAYLTYQFVPSPRTILRGVRKLRPGHWVVADRSGVREERFARSGPPPRTRLSESEAIAELQSQLEAAVRRQMISDVPVGAMLSGGVDSATVVSLMARESRSRVKTFTVGFGDDFDRDELRAARRSAEILGTDHHEIAVGAQQCVDVLPDVLWHMDEPVATPSAMAMYWLSRLAARHVKVALTGQGADEPWAGYRRYLGEKVGAAYRRVPRLFRGSFSAAVGALPRADALKRSVFSLGTEDQAERFARIYTAFTPAGKRRLYGTGQPARSVDLLAMIDYWRIPFEQLDDLGQLLAVETRFSLPDNLLLYGDKMAMAASLEARVPLLDVELMDFVESLPTSWKLKGFGRGKHLYRLAIRKWLPKEILDRPKIGFQTPIDRWLKTEMSGVVQDTLSSGDASVRDYFDRGEILRLVGDHVRGRENNTRLLFTLLTFELWHRRFVRDVTTRDISLSLSR